MTSHKDGGPAFPISREGAIDRKAAGMSLRDYFAAQAITALADDYQLNHESLAGRAYAIADALLKARSEKEE